ncbi:MAG: TPM domain-containing protein, partial [Candidatus Rokubacteria bacterium]|nr:TPM domain-containing protein [Candidatus Rokubacteria bacterium]
MLPRLLTALLLLALCASAAAAALSVPPPPARRVNDYAGALPPAERERLEQTLAARERESRNQVVVAIFPALSGESLEDYSIRLAQAWRIGQKGLDNGVIFLVFLDDR